MDSITINAAVEQAKADRLELLYQQSGRASKNHPMHALFTGLIAQAPSAQTGHQEAGAGAGAQEAEPLPPGTADA